MHRLRENIKNTPMSPGDIKHTNGARLSGEEQHLAIWAALLYLNRQFNPGKQWHHYIGNEEIRNVRVSGL